MMKEGEGMKVQNSHLLGSQPWPGLTAQSQRHQLSPGYLLSALPATFSQFCLPSLSLGPTATFLILLGHSLPPPPPGVHPLALPGCGSIASPPGDPSCVRAPRTLNRHLRCVPTTNLVPSPPGGPPGERCPGAPGRQP